MKKLDLLMGVLKGDIVLAKSSSNSNQAGNN
jgi:hypothetical protein